MQRNGNGGGKDIPRNLGSGGKMFARIRGGLPATTQGRKEREAQEARAPRSTPSPVAEEHPSQKVRFFLGKDLKGAIVKIPCPNSGCESPICLRNRGNCSHDGEDSSPPVVQAQTVLRMA